VFTESTAPLEPGGLQLQVPRHASPLVRRAIERAQAGDRAACDFLFVRYGDEVHEQLQATLHDEALAARVTRRMFALLGETKQWPMLIELVGSRSQLAAC
jgi:hypothetical protein